ncbi:MAG TPA: hypothetical protein VFB04_10025 [Terriglobales bacterium]|nr:hypothetical protein [Terriglobales bacterium]
MIRLLWALLFSLGGAVSVWAQMEPCLAGADMPQCGIKIALDPPPNPPDGNALSVPNEITVEVPSRIKATKVQLSSGPKGAQASDFKPVTEAAKFKKAGNVERFRLKVENCPAGMESLQFKVISPKFPYPITIDREYECNGRTGQ